MYCWKGYLFERDAQRRQLLLQRRRHLLVDREPHVHPQALLEAIAPPPRLAPLEMHLRLPYLRVAEDVIEVRLHHLLAVRAAFVADVRHVSPSATDSASSRLRMRRPRCSRDITVPIGMSRMFAASW